MNPDKVAAQPVSAGGVPASGIRTYVVLWCTQWIAMIAGAVSTLVLAIYIYDEYESLVVLGLGFASAYVPFVLASPIAGVLTDRWGQRRALLVSNVGTLATVLVMTALLAADRLLLWHAIVLMVIVVVLKSLQLTGIESVLPLLIPKRHYYRANGSRMLLTGTAAIMAPVVAGLLVFTFTIVQVSLLVAAAIVPAILFVSLARIPLLAGGTTATVRAELGQAVRGIRLAHGLVALLVFLFVISIVIGFIELAVQQLVYGFAGDLELVIVLVVAWSGVVTTSIAMTISGRPRQMVRGMLVAGAVFAVALVFSGLRPHLILVSLAAFVALGSTPVIMAVVQTVLHLKVEQRVLGRVIGVKNTITGTAHIIGNVSAGVLGAVLVPLVGRTEVGSPAVATVVGQAGNRGYAVLLIAMGVGVAISVIIASRHRRLARWQQLPDATLADRAAAGGRSGEAAGAHGAAAEPGATDSAPAAPASR